MFLKCHQCVFCQELQDYVQLKECTKCSHHKDIHFECNNYVIECDINGSIIDGVFLHGLSLPISSTKKPRS